MYTWHPESWSQQARRCTQMAINYLNWGREKDEEHIAQSIQYYNHLWSHSYRPQIITYRAAKRWGKYLKRFFKKYPQYKKYNKFLESLD